MQKQFDIVALGELLIDFTEYGVSNQGNPVWEANPGGAPCNVLAMLKKLGKHVSFIGKIGADVYGRQLKAAVEEVGIGTEGLCIDTTTHTTLAIVSKLPNGDRDFAFYRNPGADMMLSPSDVNKELLQSAKIFHFGTLSMTHEGVKKATKFAVQEAKNSGALISFDPNFRPPLWEKETDMLSAAKWGFSFCDVLKISDNEIQLLTGEQEIQKATSILLSTYPNIRLLSVTMGPDGSYTAYNGKLLYSPAILSKHTVETTGAGDTYTACVLNFLLENGLENLSDESILSMMNFAAAAASLVTTKKGALRVMPTKEEVLNFLSSQDR